jgi:hypothetical protein
MTASTARDRLWPLWAVPAGLGGMIATVVLDVRPAGESAAADRGDEFTVSDAVMNELDRLPNYLGFLVGFVAIACLLMFAGAWRARVEQQHPRSIGSAVVTLGVVASAAGLALAYGWKGALANYGYTGNEFGMFDDAGLYVYFMLTDFSPYIPWLGVLVSFAAMAWLAWIERTISRVLGTVLGLYAALIAGAYVVTGVPGLAGPLSGAVLALAGIWLSVGRSRATLRPLTVPSRVAHPSAPATLETPVVETPAQG